MPKVSVIFPMYNVAEYVKDSVTSVLNQTFRDFELIAVNDGATDNTEDVFNDAVRDCSDITIKLIKKENGGLSDARNKGLDAAKGEYVVFVDSDDVIHPRYLEVMVADAEQYNADLVVSTFKMVTKETLHDYEDIVPGELIDQAEMMNKLLLRKDFITGCWCLMIRRSMIIDNDMRFNTDVRFSVDQAFIWESVDRSGKTVINYSKLYQYYLRPGSIMTASKKEDICSGVDHFTNVVNRLQHLPFPKETLINRWKFGILHSAAKLTDYDGFKEIRKKTGLEYRDCLNNPDIRIKLLALLGIVAEKMLYRILKR